MSSFRVRGKIFATVPPDEAHLHVFVDEEEITASLAENPAAFEPLRWGDRIRGLRVNLAPAPESRVSELLAGILAAQGPQAPGRRLRPRPGRPAQGRLTV